ncbi:uncharacterized protein LY89DRAFT_190286 [Mollisia scopiformis]|uniref:Uncharacterized protein n=1 Tax=Mollisia scopiformis TaxID=149040 RepID=A0A194WYL1_MOLSC|nr:uncharacterized protein LY89DRAFT_190286 [Mollisia scopiformis]KUJ12692.1 hypothetical protein LY89DRAFT_190286 [Mollisia scopiformis]
MADDSMEISSEHGQNTGDDIDIDIDITAGQADEDYILQDTLSTVDYGNEFPTQPSPAVHHDDLMVDDDNASYQMDDADFIQDEAEHIAEPESMSFAQTDILYTHGDDGSAADAIIYSEDHDIGLFFGQDGGNEMDATGRDLVLDSENISHDGNIAPIPEGVLPHADTILPQDYSNQGDQADKSPSQSLGPSPQSRSPAAAAEEPRSPPASLGHLSPVRESNDTISDPTSNPQEASGEVDEPESIEHTYDFLTARGVKVVYQSVEYALFATSDSDDPDSYFLSDLAIIEKPLEQFFSAIREIIRDDLTADEELCLNVEDLGLETEEASSNLKDVTLSQILNLHDELLRNDSVDSPGPLYLLLGTRVNFIKRLASLAEGASLGKGFSEMAGLENRSQSVDDVGDGDETARNVQSNYENLERANDATGDTTQGIEKGDLENGPSTEDQVDSLEIYEEAEVPDDEKEASERHDEQQAAPEEYPEDYDDKLQHSKESTQSTIEKTSNPSQWLIVLP